MLNMGKCQETGGKQYKFFRRRSHLLGAPWGALVLASGREVCLCVYAFVCVCLCVSLCLCLHAPLFVYIFIFQVFIRIFLLDCSVILLSP